MTSWFAILLDSYDKFGAQIAITNSQNTLQGRVIIPHTNNCLNGSLSHAATKRQQILEVDRNMAAHLLQSLINPLPRPDMITDGVQEDCNIDNVLGWVSSSMLRRRIIFIIQNKRFFLKPQWARVSTMTNYTSDEVHVTIPTSPTLCLRPSAPGGYHSSWTT